MNARRKFFYLSTLLILAGFFIIFGSLRLRQVPVLAASSDGLAIRIIPNPNHYSPMRWYQEQGFTGAPQSLTVDGYDAVRDGRTVYVSAANIDYKNGVVTYYTNIYLISYNQEALNQTTDIFGQIIKKWHFNTNITRENQLGACAINTATSCFNDSECASGDYCTSPKAKIIRDTKRLADLQDIKRSLTAYQRTHKNTFPKISSGSYVPGLVISVWPSWQNVLGAALGSTVPLDPINKLSQTCNSTSTNYNIITGWDNTIKRFCGYDYVHKNLSTSTPLLTDSRMYIYQARDKFGNGYDLGAVMESGFVTKLSDGAWAGSAGTPVIGPQSFDNYTNLVTNSSFEANNAGWWANLSITAVTSAEHKIGNKSLKVTFVQDNRAPSTSGYGDNYLVYNLPDTPGAPVTTTRDYKFSFWAKTDNPNGATLSYPPFLQTIEGTLSNMAFCQIDGDLTLTTAWKQFQKTCTGVVMDSVHFRVILRSSGDVNSNVYYDGVGVYDLTNTQNSPVISSAISASGANQPPAISCDGLNGLSGSNFTHYVNFSDDQRIQSMSIRPSLPDSWAKWVSDGGWQWKTSDINLGLTLDDVKRNNISNGSGVITTKQLGVGRSGNASATAYKFWLTATDALGSSTSKECSISLVTGSAALSSQAVAFKAGASANPVSISNATVHSGDLFGFAAVTVKDPHSSNYPMTVGLQLTSLADDHNVTILKQANCTDLRPSSNNTVTCTNFSQKVDVPRGDYAVGIVAIPNHATADRYESIGGNFILKVENEAPILQPTLASFDINATTSPITLFKINTTDPHGDYPVNLFNISSNLYNLFFQEDLSILTPSNANNNSRISPDLLGYNLIANSSFETDVSGWWGNLSNFTATTAEHKVGNKSLKMTWVDGPGLNDNYLVYSLPESATPIAGKNYVFSFWAKTDKPGGATFSSAPFLQTTNGTHPYSAFCILGNNNFNLETTWKEFRIACTVDASLDSTTFRAALRAPRDTNYSVYYDDVRVENGNLVGNGTFEKDITGWSSNLALIKQYAGIYNPNGYNEFGHDSNHSLKVTWVNDSRVSTTNGYGDNYVYYQLPGVPKTLAGRTYVFSFWAKADKEGQLTSAPFLQSTSGAMPWFCPVYTAATTKALTTSWQPFSASCTVDASLNATDFRIVLRSTGDVTNNVYYDDVAVRDDSATRDGNLTWKLKSAAADYCVGAACYGFMGSLLNSNIFTTSWTNYNSTVMVYDKFKESTTSVSIVTKIGNTPPAITLKCGSTAANPDEWTNTSYYTRGGTPFYCRYHVNDAEGNAFKFQYKWLNGPITSMQVNTIGSGYKNTLSGSDPSEYTFSGKLSLFNGTYAPGSIGTIAGGTSVTGACDYNPGIACQTNSDCDRSVGVCDDNHNVCTDGNIGAYCDYDSDCEQSISGTCNPGAFVMTSATTVAATPGQYVPATNDFPLTTTSTLLTIFASSTDEFGYATTSIYTMKVNNYCGDGVATGANIENGEGVKEQCDFGSNNANDCTITAAGASCYYCTPNTCQLKIKSNGLCGTANSKTYNSAATPATGPTTDAEKCTVGTAGHYNFNSSTQMWDWDCAGENGGSGMRCSAFKKADGVCGVATNSAWTSMPNSNLCSDGIIRPSLPTVNVSNYVYSWTCDGKNGGASLVCHADQKVNGVCGGAKGQIFGAVAPSGNVLCNITVDTPAVSPIPGSYTWTCTGTHGGTNDACSASRQFCGDGTINPGEACDRGAAANTNTACSAGYGSSCTYCKADCSALNTVVGPHCNDNIVNGPETCDGSNYISWAPNCPTDYSGGARSCSSCQVNLHSCYHTFDSWRCKDTGSHDWWDTDSDCKPVPFSGYSSCSDPISQVDSQFNRVGVVYGGGGTYSNAICTRLDSNGNASGIDTVDCCGGGGADAARSLYHCIKYNP